MPTVDTERRGAAWAAAVREVQARGGLRVEAAPVHQVRGAGRVESVELNLDLFEFELMWVEACTAGSWRGGGGSECCQ